MLFASLLGSTAQDARFFRVAGPVPVTITSINADGYVTWTNELTNVTFTVQTAVDLGNESNWVDYIQVPASNVFTMHRLTDPGAPQGMAFIPSGIFQMGDTFGEITANNPRPVHPVYVSACYMEKYEVTKAVWDEAWQWGTNHGYSFDNVGIAQAGDHPVNWVNWYDMLKWCNARSEKEGLEPCYYTNPGQTNAYRTGQIPLVNSHVKWTANGYRLPTEAEWEKAARGGLRGKRFPWGNTISHSYANYFSITNNPFDLGPTPGLHPAFASQSNPNTSPAGTFLANGYGLHDVAGNVFESCWDAYGGYSSNLLVNPRGPETRNSSSLNNVMRGGGWKNVAGYPVCSCAFRFIGFSGTLISFDLGFRCVRSTGLP